MTDNTQPAAGSTHIIRYALEMGLLWIDGDGRDKVREALDALDTLEAQLASIGAGGVSGRLEQAISAEPAGAGYAELPDAKTLGEAVAAWIGVETRGAHNWVDTTVDRLGFAVRSVMGDMLRASHGQAPAQPDCMTCNDHGAVGNILTAEPCPDCTPTPQAADTGAAQGAVGVPSDGQKDRLLAALERAAAAEFELRLLVDECDNDCIPGWEERMSERIASANRLLAAAPQPATADTVKRRELVTNWFAENWAIEKAFGLLDDYDAAQREVKP